MTKENQKALITLKEKLIFRIAGSNFFSSVLRYRELDEKQFVT